MTIAVAITSIYILAGIAWMADRWSRMSVCPICVGVSGTWAWMLMARETGIMFDDGVILLLMGASVVGVAYSLERRAKRRSVLFKLVFIPSGMLAAWALITSFWGLSIAAGAVAVVSPLLLQWGRLEPRTESGRELKEQMKDCC